jgi:N-methylhydantoinase A/oxoprolinase/acetone carboxylase beta subunit
MSNHFSGGIHMTVATSSVQVMGIDAGGTMTDTFFVRDDGRFVVGKAQSNPGDESLAIYNSSIDALAHWGRTVDDVYPELVTCVYSGTAMLNRVLMRKGLDVGLICNRGFEQIHSMGRALQSYLGYALEDRIHLNTHRYDEPLVPVSRTRGVTERTDVPRQDRDSAARGRSPHRDQGDRRGWFQGHRHLPAAVSQERKQRTACA